MDGGTCAEMLRNCGAAAGTEAVQASVRASQRTVRRGAMVRIVPEQMVSAAHHQAELWSPAQPLAVPSGYAGRRKRKGGPHEEALVCRYHRERLNTAELFLVKR